MFTKHTNLPKNQKTEAVKRKKSLPWGDRFSICLPFTERTGAGNRNHTLTSLSLEVSLSLILAFMPASEACICGEIGAWTCVCPVFLDSPLHHMLCLSGLFCLKLQIKINQQFITTILL
jgi:hypothetical protein